MPPIYCRPMSIKSDRWIRRMATERRMIEPFAENQARAGIISYGVSSYGYDMRVAPEFKIFTNAPSAVVDPKRFDRKSFVEFMGDAGDECEISYKDKEGKYQGQQGITLPKL